MKKVPVLAYVFALLCLLAVQGFGQNGAPVVAMSSPGGNGSGSSIHFHVTAADPNGVNDIGWLGIGVGMGWQYPGGCFILVYPNADKNYIVLLNDASTVWNGPFGIGGQWVAENSQCSINMATFSRVVSLQSNGSLTADFDVNFKSSFVGQRYIYTIASDLAGWYGGGNPTAGWYVTLPTNNNTNVPGSSGTQQITDIVETATDAFSGSIANIPTTARPAPYAELYVPSGTRVARVGDHITITLSNVKPNSQVWIAETAVTDPGVAQGAYTSSGYVGMSDNAGQFIWQAVVSPWTEAHTYTAWVGYWGGSATGPRPDSDIVANVSLWATDASGNPAAPGTLAQLTNQ